MNFSRQFNFTHMFAKLTCTVIVIPLIIIKVSSACYFPIEYQGTFLIQTQASAADGGSIVTYSEITIESDAIPPWGRCHRRRGNNVILKDSTGAEDCMRCFHLTMKTPNVIQLHTEGLARCYTNEDAARATCPLDKDVVERKFKEIMLFRKHVPGGLQSIEHVFCPINGRYRFSYMANNGELHCDQNYSELSNCPHGNALGAKFRQCSFPAMDIHFLCLGDWESHTGDRYLALMDLREEPEARPKYRCGLFREEQSTGQIHVSLSADSTCQTQLTSATSGFESLNLSPLPSKKLPSIVENSKCRFPEWMQGKWERSRIEGNRLTFKDELNQFRTITSRCVIRQNNTPNDRFIIHSITQCGDEAYSCVWTKRRSPNILELQFSDKSSPVMVDSICDDKHFTGSVWITQGRTSVAQATACPITGDYTGVVPGTNGLCAKVASDCNNPDIMFYSVSSCENRTHVLEEREYRCLGNWEEDGILYTYTARRDMPGHQCFAGKIFRNGDEAFIKEAGDIGCIRGEDPLIFGMKITKQASCPRQPPVTSYVPMRPNWQNIPEKVFPMQPPVYPPIRPLPPPGIKPILPPPPRPPITKDPYWYQAETSTTKSWKQQITGRPRTATEENFTVLLTPFKSLILMLTIIGLLLN